MYLSQQYVIDSVCRSASAAREYVARWVCVSISTARDWLGLSICRKSTCMAGCVDLLHQYVIGWVCRCASSAREPGSLGLSISLNSERCLHSNSTLLAGSVDLPQQRSSIVARCVYLTLQFVYHWICRSASTARVHGSLCLSDSTVCVISGSVDLPQQPQYVARCV